MKIETRAQDFNCLAGLQTNILKKKWYSRKIKVLQDSKTAEFVVVRLNYWELLITLIYKNFLNKKLKGTFKLLTVNELKDKFSKIVPSNPNDKQLPNDTFLPKPEFSPAEATKIAQTGLLHTTLQQIDFENHSHRIFELIKKFLLTSNQKIVELPQKALDGSLKSEESRAVLEWMILTEMIAGYSKESAKEGTYSIYTTLPSDLTSISHKATIKATNQFLQSLEFPEAKPDFGEKENKFFLKITEDIFEIYRRRKENLQLAAQSIFFIDLETFNDLDLNSISNTLDYLVQTSTLLAWKKAEVTNQLGIQLPNGNHVPDSEWRDITVIQECQAKRTLAENVLLMVDADFARAILQKIETTPGALYEAKDDKNELGQILQNLQMINFIYDYTYVDKDGKEGYFIYPKKIDAITHFRETHCIDVPDEIITSSNLKKEEQEEVRIIISNLNNRESAGAIDWNSSLPLESKLRVKSFLNSHNIKVKKSLIGENYLIFVNLEDKFSHFKENNYLHFDQKLLTKLGLEHNNKAQELLNYLFQELNLRNKHEKYTWYIDPVTDEPNVEELLNLLKDQKIIFDFKKGNEEFSYFEVYHKFEDTINKKNAKEDYKWK